MLGIIAAIKGVILNPAVQCGAVSAIATVMKMLGDWKRNRALMKYTDAKVNQLRLEMKPELKSK